MAFQPVGEPQLSFCASYPKSGNTWIRLTCGAYAMGKEADPQDFVEWDDISLQHYQIVSPVPITQVGPELEVCFRPAAMFALSLQVDSHTLVKSHHASMDVNGIHLWNDQWTRRVVCPIRDPRDVCCSVADHFGMTHEEAVEFMDYGTANIGGGPGKLHHFLGSWSDHVSSWLDNETAKVHTVRYRDLQEDPMGEFQEILEFLGIEEVESDRLEMAVEGTSFDKMQEAEEEHGFPERSQHQDRFFRKGEAGGWQDELPEELAGQIAEDHGEVMERVGFLE